MWLINTATFQLEAVKAPEEHPYAILSHTWEHEEISFHEMSNLSQARKKYGFLKIERTCLLAREHGLHYAWVDTCCIDKKSSAELTEAINSMFQWYNKSSVCFVLLSDLSQGHEMVPSMYHSLSRCRWLTRGWTLQELIASKNIDFYNQDWIWIGNKASLGVWLSQITNVDIEVLEDSERVSSVAVAKRMSWAAQRQTTRIEDLSYCLFGIFNVNLPLIYGEGSKAFFRLQEAIIADNNDLSLFAWAPYRDSQTLRGAFARSPIEFQGCGNIVRLLDPVTPDAEFALTNRGVRFTTHLGSDTLMNQNYQMSLQCIDSSRPEGLFLGGGGGKWYPGSGFDNGVIVIHLIKTAHGYVRLGSDTRGHIPTSAENYRPTYVSGGEEATFYIPKDVSFSDSQSLSSTLLHCFAVTVINGSYYQYDIKRRPEHLWETNGYSFITDGHEEVTGLLRITLSDTKANPDLQEKSDEAGPWTHESRYDIIFGLRRPDDRVEDRAIVNRNQLRPWAVVQAYDGASKVAEILDQERLRGFPSTLKKLGAVLRHSTENSPLQVSQAPEYWRKGVMFVDSSSTIQIRISVGLSKNRSNNMYYLMVNISGGSKR